MLTFAVSPPIRKALPADPFERGLSALGIVNEAGVVTEVELPVIALQMLLRDVVIDAEDAALEDREITLNRVRMSVSAHVLIDTVVDRFVTCH